MNIFLQTNTVVKPHFEQRDAMPSSRSQSQNYNYSAKSNLISLGVSLFRFAKIFQVMYLIIFNIYN